jgi:predicted glycosyltransferase involved in capsule biosynthesis
MIDLKNTTLIIPIKIEHPDRYRNIRILLDFLNKNVETNVFIFESSSDGNSKIDFLDKLENLKIKKWIINEEKEFHRTKYLNIMLDEVETSVVANYDVDVLLSPDNFLECQNNILSGKSDVIYPYRIGNGQIMVMRSFDYEAFVKSGYDFSLLAESSNCVRSLSECGHCVFFNTDIYRKNGGENENFISYGPEDQERMIRFQRLGYNVHWADSFYVYHLEHYRGSDSSYTNPRFSSNWDEFNKINSMSPESIREYYRSCQYQEQYKNINSI